MRGDITMLVSEITQMLSSDEYKFLKTNEHLNKNIILLCLGGSHAYGTNHEGSDVDVRGIAVNTKNEILLGEDFEQVVDINTDTTVYSFNKIIKLLTSCNPNTIEILGCKPDHYLYTSKIGRYLIENRHIFLSQLASYTFTGYATSQLRRMENKAARKADQPKQENNILKSIQNAQIDFKRRYLNTSDNIRLYIDKARNPELSEEIYMDVNLTKYPLRDYNGMVSEMQAIVRTYEKDSMRNRKAEIHDKLGKHMAHLIRLLLTGTDIMEKQEIITYRESDIPLLKSIIRGDYLDDNEQPIPEFYELVEECNAKFEYAKKYTSLPELPDKSKIDEFKATVNEMIVKGEWN